MRDKNLLYITFCDLDKGKSGSSVRPRKMLKAFICTGVNVDIISGDGWLFRNANRNIQIKKSLEKINKNFYDYCYIESSTFPISGHFDRKLIKILHNRGVKIAYFLRDDYYRLGRRYLENSLRIKKLTLYSKIFSFLTNRVLRRYCDIVYTPSDTFSKYCSFPNMKALPPAGEIYDGLPCIKNKTGIYVGTCSSNYGTDKLLKLFKTMNIDDNYNLIIITNVSNFLKKYGEYYGENWLILKEASGKKLADYYNKASVAFLLKEEDIYNDMSVSVKIYEYLSYGKALVMTPRIEQKKIVEASKAGAIISDEITNADVKIVKNIFYNNEEYCKNALEYIKNGNSWVSRAETVLKDLASL